MSLLLNEQALLPEPDRDRSLIEAYDDLARSLCPSGTDGQIDEWSIYDESFRGLVKWAEEKGCSRLTLRENFCDAGFGALIDPAVEGFLHGG